MGAWGTLRMYVGGFLLLDADCAFICRIPFLICVWLPLPMARLFLGSLAGRASVAQLGEQVGYYSGLLIGWYGMQEQLPHTVALLTWRVARTATQYVRLSAVC